MHPRDDTRIFKNQCVSLAKAGYKVTLIAPGADETEIDGVDIVPVTPAKSFVERVWIRPQQAKQIALDLKADLYHFHDPELVPAMKALAREVEVPVVWDAHEDYSDTIAAFNSFRFQPLSSLGARMFGRYEIAAAKKRFAGIVTVNEALADRFREVNTNVAVVSNYSRASDVVSEAEMQISPVPLMMSSGAQFVDRGVIEMAAAFGTAKKQVPELEIAFCGTFHPEGLREQLTNTIMRTSGSLEQVRIEGPFSWNELVCQIIPRAWMSCVLFDTSSENNLQGLPNRFFESWACGVPVMATAGTRVAELVEEFNGGIVIKENSVSEIANAFVKIAQNPDLQSQMSRNARKAAIEKFSWKVAFGELVSLYEKLGVSSS